MGTGILRTPTTVEPRSGGGGVFSSPDADRHHVRRQRKSARLGNDATALGFPGHFGVMRAYGLLVEVSPKLANLSDVHSTPSGHLDEVVGRFTEMLIQGSAR